MYVIMNSEIMNCNIICWAVGMLIGSLDKWSIWQVVRHETNCTHDGVWRLVIISTSAS